MSKKRELGLYVEEFTDSLHKTQATNQDGTPIALSRGVKDAVVNITGLSRTDGTMVFVGNGGSAAIASHQATDFIRTCKIRAYAPLDFSLLTCMSNDCGYENVFAEPLKVLLKPEDILIAISSSGRSPNILNAVRVAREKGCRIVTLSGFEEGNPLRQSGDTNFYVPSDSYRIVESAHLFICNWLLEFTIQALEF